MKKYWILILILLVVGAMVFWPRKVGNGLKPFRTTEYKEINKEPIINSKIAFMADIHNDIESLHKAYERAKNDGVEIIFLVGDLTINGTILETQKIKNEINSWEIKNYAVPGNHDLWKVKGEGDDTYGTILGAKYQSVKFDGVKYILINNGSWKGLGEEQKQWLMTELPECKIIKCIGVMHMPLLNSFSKHIMGENSEKVTAEGVWLKDILLSNNVKTGYSGHLHYASSYTIDDWETVLVGAISKDRNTQTPRFTEVEYSGTSEGNVKVIVL